MYHRHQMHRSSWCGSAAEIYLIFTDFLVTSLAIFRNYWRALRDTRSQPSFVAVECQFTSNHVAVPTSRRGAESGLPCSLLNEAEIENLAGWNIFGCAAESFLG